MLRPVVPLISVGLALADQRKLRFGRRFRKKIVDTRFGGDRGRRQAIVAGDHHRLDTHAPQLAEAFLDASLDDVLQLDDAVCLGALRNDERRAAALLRNFMLVYGVGGIILPFIGIKVVDMILAAVGLA